MKKVIIVGSGIGGLSAAIYLQNAGYQVEIYEKNDQIGGKMGRFEKEGFKFDVGPTIVMMPHIYQQVFHDTGVNPDDYFTMSRLEPFMDVFVNDHDKTYLTSDLTKLASQYESVSPSEFSGFLSYLNDIYKRYLVAKDHFIQRSFRKPLDFWNPKTLYNALKLKTFGSSYGSLKKYLKNEDLVKLMAFQTLYIGVSPYNGPSIYNIIPMIELIYGVWFIDGGMYQYARALEKRFTELGGKIHLNTHVDQVTFNGKTASGIKIAGKQIPADGVIVNADFPYAMNHLIQDSTLKKRKYQQEKIDKLEYGTSCFLLYLGTDKRYDSNLNLHNLKMANDFTKNIKELEQSGLPTDPSYYLYMPSKLDRSFTPNDKSESIYILVPVPNLKLYDNWNDSTIAQFREQILNKVSELPGMADLQSHIVSETIYTPDDFKNKFNAANGATFGLKPTLLQSNYFRPHNKYPYAEHLYFAGSSVHPGAGVPIVITSGQLAANELKKDIEPND